MDGGQPRAPKPASGPVKHSAHETPPVPTPPVGKAGSPAQHTSQSALDTKAPTSTDQSQPGSSPATVGNNAQRIIKRRSPVACRRCRRMRSKCVHNGAKPPCEGCRAAGVSVEECVFPARGAPDMDREYRHPRMKGDKARKESTRTHRAQLAGGTISSSPPGGGSRLIYPNGTITIEGGVPLPADPWDLLPPLENVIDAVDMFTRQYFQLGFIPRHTFVQQLREQPQSVSVFLLLSLLSVSARMTPSLVETHGGAGPTAELFMDRASAIALTELYQEPTLARCQAFYLLSLAQQGSGYRNRSFVNLGIALRMAILMQLHREETYALDDRTPAMIQKAESARRTLWMLYSQDNLHAGPMATIALAPSDITTLLPSNEEDFNNGVLPASRAALEDTSPAKLESDLVNMPTRSLFATLMQSHQLWGIVLRRTVSNNRSMVLPWDPNSEYQKIKQKLSDWESRLPAEHRWSRTLLRDYKARDLDLLARQLGVDSPHARSASPSAGGNISNGSGGGANGTGHGSIQLPHFRPDASLINSPMRLPPPQPSPNLVTNTASAAAHFATAPSTLPSTLVLPPPAPHNLQLGGGGMRTPTSFAQGQSTPNMQHQNHQHHQQSPSHQGAEIMSPNGNAIASMANPLAAVQSGVASTLPQLPSMPQASHAHPDGHSNNFMMQRYDKASTNTSEEAEAAAVLAGGMVSHGVVGYGASQLHQQQQQLPPQHDNPYVTQHLSEQGHGVHTDPLSVNDMSMMTQMPSVGFYEQTMIPELPDDGFQGELQYFTQGPGLQAGSTWATNSVFGF
ncbi:transcription factor [Sporothrix brasiliensis 5110]|uniref:Transcription factor n=1 Tax=Sporothrix brasiliensis 5110 TaxID=1398154 RepID=A0A0C2J6S6_9PEZI|nr:transcription factor [Sporothrix brasiliensis 5110]KIH94650.1 transcription factor [Sporothrix brasiliensis 5110]